MSSLALGGFDGLHLGHRAVIDRAMTLSSDASILCFEPLPRQALGGERQVRLTTPSERRKILSRSGRCGLMIHPFDETTRNAAPDVFLDTLYDCCRFDQLVVGYDFHYGRGRSGSPDSIRKWCDRMGLGLDVVDPVCDDGVPIKSGRIRGLVAAGDLDAAASLLGRRYSALGVVERGRGLGRKTGFPTLNVHVPAAKLLPPPGSYAATVEVDGAARPAAVFIPPRRICLCEAHLPGWTGDVYGAAVGIEFRLLLRPPENGLATGELVPLIARDVERVLEVTGE